MRLLGHSCGRVPQKKGTSAISQLQDFLPQGRHLQFPSTIESSYSNGCLLDLDKKNELQATPLGSCSFPYWDSSSKALKLEPYPWQNPRYGQCLVCPVTTKNSEQLHPGTPICACVCADCDDLKLPFITSQFFLLPSTSCLNLIWSNFQTFQRCNFVTHTQQYLGAEGANGNGSSFSNGFPYNPYAGCICLLSFRTYTLCNPKQR